MNSSESFKIGLCMAGAISAGAYTAGVMDYLIEALDSWEKQKSVPGVPKHNVVISAIGGASAGGMTGILTAAAIHNKISPIDSIDDLKKEHPENKFWSTWVDMDDFDMFKILLDREDIQKGDLKSLLNSGFIDKIANRVVHIDPSNLIPRPYFDKHMKLFVTICSLRGLGYKVPFGGMQEENFYYISRHNDYMAFILNKDKNEYAGDGWMPLDFINGTSVELAREAAMATGAFPIAFTARYLARESKYINDLLWHKKNVKNNPVSSKTYESINVDGGMINNEPFEKLKDLIPSDSNPDGFSGTLVMIDPFPSIVPTYNPGDLLFEVAGNTLSALVNQARVKPEEIETAFDEDNYSQFVIAPVGIINGTKAKGEKAIACGAFGGFSGFLKKEFRIHDYFLGRKNCEVFLRDHFTVPENSDNIITRGYSSLSKEERNKFYAKKKNQSSVSANLLPIIPILKDRNQQQGFPVFSSQTDWPTISKKEINNYKGLLKKRVGSIIMNLDDYSFTTKILLGIGNRILLRGKLTDRILDKIKDSLASHQLLS